MKIAIGLAFASIAAAGCGSSGSSSQGGGAGVAGPTVPTANLAVVKKIGKGEGQLNLIAWAGYLQPQWVKPFEQQTGCMIHATYPNTSDEFVTLMKNGGGGQWDMASSSGDADLRIIYAGDAHPVNINLIPSWKQFFPAFKSPPFNTVNGVHYGVSLQWGPNVLMYNKKAFTTPPTSWSVIYSKQYAGKITIPNNPIQIADAALYLSVHQPKLGISDPYELTQSQFNAAVNLLKQEKPLIKAYWNLASDEISLFANGEAVVGAAWPYQTGQLQGAGDKVADTIPSEGATGWADSWLLATKAPHPNCAYKWLAYISTAKVQAEQAVNYGETPDNSLACPLMNKLQKGSCDSLHANEPDAYFKSIKFWKTPLAQCDNGKSDCVPFQQWVTAWTQITG
jgi:putative spermidine/putrescine transport system substrate-binding protein